MPRGPSSRVQVVPRRRLQGRWAGPAVLRSGSPPWAVSGSSAHASRPRRGALRLAGIILGGLAVLLVVAPASAHTDLRSSKPADGSVLKAPPKAVTLVFDEDLLAAGAAVSATRLPDGDRIDLPDPVVRDGTLRVAWPAREPAGRYRVAYRVVSADGHPVRGSITFRYRRGLAVSTVAPDAMAGSQETSGRVGGVEALGPTPEKAPMAPGLLLAIMIAGVLVLAVALGGVLSTRRGQGPR